MRKNLQKDSLEVPLGSKECAPISTEVLSYVAKSHCGESMLGVSVRDFNVWDIS